MAATRYVQIISDILRWRRWLLQLRVAYVQGGAAIAGGGPSRRILKSTSGQSVKGAKEQ